MRKTVAHAFPVTLLAIGMLLLAGVANGRVLIDFRAASHADERNAKVYRTIWERDGERIVKAFEAWSCMPFAEPEVSAVVAEAVSHSGGPDHPMRLRASYFFKVKQATLVHELGHRHLWQLAERLEGIDGHRTLYLILDRVWAEVWGEKFAAELIRHESGWIASYDYAAAWKWVRALNVEKRRELWDRLLVMNGFAPGCREQRTVHEKDLNGTGVAAAERQPGQQGEGLAVLTGRRKSL